MPDSALMINPLRRFFVLDPEVIFLNHGSFGACPVEVLEEQQRWRLEMEKNPVEFLGRRSAQLLYQSRQALGEYIGTSPDRIVYVSNATTGINTVARSLPLAPGDVVLSSDHEYGACDNVWEFICRKRGAVYQKVPIPLPYSPAEMCSRIISAVTPKTRAIYISQLSSTTALIFPVAEICAHARRLGILTVIDGAHAPGQLDVDLDCLGADFYVGNCHKWLCSPKGAGFLYVRPEHHEMIQAAVISWGYSQQTAGHTGFSAYTGSSILERKLQWQGTRDISAWLSVPAAIAFLRKHHWQRRRRECHATLVLLKKRLENCFGLPPICSDDDFSQMAALPIPDGSAEKIRDLLYNQYRIEVPVTSHGNRLFVRPSFQIYNTGAEADVLLDALLAIFRGGEGI